MNTLTKAAANGTSGQMVAVSQEIQREQGFFLVAQQAPRDEDQVWAELKLACQDPELANEASYEYRRGGQLITGPSIRLAEEAARCWGRMDYGWKVVEETAEWAEVRTEAIDYQRLLRVHRDVRVFFTIGKKDGETKVITDPRDRYEHIANHASRRVRACIEQIIPTRILNLAMIEIDNTIKNADTRPLADRIVAMVDAFATRGVTKAQLEKYLGSSTESFTAGQLVRMKKVFAALRDGAARNEDYFSPDAPPVDVKVDEVKPVATETKTEAKEEAKGKKPGGAKKGAQKTQVDDAAKEPTASVENHTTATSTAPDAAPATTDAPIIDFGFTD